jgi:hypothetical protein
MTLIRFTISAEIERESGKFAPKEEIVDVIREVLEEADPSEIAGLGADGASVYTVTSWEVSEFA